MKKGKKLTVVSIILGALYLLITVLFVFNLLSLPNQYEKMVSSYVTTVSKEVDAALNLPEKEDVYKRIQELVNQYPMEIIIEENGIRLLETVDINFTYGNENVLNQSIVALEKSGSFEDGESNYQFWYAVYQMPDSQFVKDFFAKQIILYFISFIALSVALFLIQKTLTTPLVDVKKAIKKMNQYDFDLDMQESDDIRSEMQHFASKLDHDIQKISMDQTKLNSKLQQEQSYLNNALMISRGLIHELKTPLFQTLHENEIRSEQLLTEEAKGLAKYNIERTDSLLREINQMLLTLKNSQSFLLEEQEVDLAVILFEEIKGFKKEFEKQDLVVNINLPDSLKITVNKVCLQMLIRNLIINITQYATPDTEVEIDLYEEDGKIILSSVNQSNEENMERMRNSEHLLNVVSSQNEYSSGNGLFIIKNLINMLNGTYDCKINLSEVKIVLEFVKEV